MRSALLVSTLALLSSALPAQAVNNYGLTASSGSAFAGRACNTAGCASSGLTVTPGATVTFEVWGTPASFYGLGVSDMPGQCSRIPGIGNGLLLGAPIATVALGVLSNPVGPSICLGAQESATVTVALPAALSGVRFRLQAITIGGVGSSTMPVFTDAIDLGIQ